MNTLVPRLKKISIHHIGNKTNDEELMLSKKTLSLDNNLALVLKNHLLQRFANINEEFHFNHPQGIKYNPCHGIISDMFSGEMAFHKGSVALAQHLFENTTHPMVKAGELYIGHFEDCEIDGKMVEAVGIFKTENRTKFFDLYNDDESFVLEQRDGIDLGKFEKGCLVFNTRERNGFIAYLIDNQSRGAEAQYWKDDFLGLEQSSNEFSQTSQFMDITKKFVTKQMGEEFEVSKTDKIDLLNRSVEYFKTNEVFDKKDFEKEVFQHADVIQSFRKFDNEYRENQDMQIPDNFEISVPAVKKQSRAFKSVLKLDKNFHVYIHGNRELIQQGVEKDGRKFYKIYFDEET